VKHVPTDDRVDPVGPDEAPPFHQGRGSPAILPESCALDEFPSEGEDEERTVPPTPIRAAALPAQRGTERAAAVRSDVANPAGDDVPFPAAIEAITLFDLLDRRDAMEWREAIALVHGLCEHLTDWPDDAVLDARKILIGSSGDIRAMPGPPGGDPIVVQIGRLLRALLVNKTVPPEVRLILSQATFELPIFDSVADLARALGQVSSIDQNDGVRLAYARAMSGEEVVTLPVGEVLPPPRSILPVPRSRRLAGRFRQRKDDALLVATAAVGVAACAALAVAGWTSRRAATTPVLAPPVVSAAVDDRRLVSEALTFEPSRPVAAPEVSKPRPIPASPPARPPAQTRVLPPVAAPEVVDSRTERPVPRPQQPPDVTPLPAQDAERRATAFVRAGRTAEAEIAFDALVFNHPMYEPNPAAIPPEAYAQFQASRRSMLPVITARELGRASAALDQGNVDRAVAIARDLNALLARVGTDASPDLRAQAQLLLDQAVEVRSAAEQRIYTNSDSGVVAPRALSRQFPLSPPTDVRPDRLGVLEIVVGTEGDVVFIKLHTPLNRYHERMVVSAAKAWRYRPATKGGKPVRYRLMVTVNLPESGTQP
jgi:hypothetical protein